MNAAVNIVSKGGIAIDRLHIHLFGDTRGT